VNYIRVHELANTSGDRAQYLPKLQLCSDLIGELQEQLESAVLNG